MQLGTTIEKKFTGKFIFATNKDLELVEQGLFMSDLYDRFNVFKISIPPLRNRKEDIPLLVEHFVRYYGERVGQGFGSLKVAKDCIKYLKSFEWKGNIRTLENAIKETVARQIGFQDRSEITEEDLPDFITKSQGARSPKSKKEKGLLGNMQSTNDEINESLKETGGNRAHAAKILGANPCTIHRRLNKMKALKRSEHILNPD